MNQRDNDMQPERSWKKFQPTVVSKRRLSRSFQRAERASTKHAHKFVVSRWESVQSARRHIVAWLLMVAAVIAAIVGQLSIESVQYTDAAASSGGTYTEGFVGELTTLNPLYASTTPEIAASKLMFASLYEYDESGSLRPGLAEDIEYDEKNKRYVVSLRENIAWSDGVPLTADDVVFTIQTIKNPEARVKSSLQVSWADVDVAAADARTVYFTLPSYAAFPHALTFPVVPKHVLENVPPSRLQQNAFSRNPVASGAFLYRRLQTNDRLSNSSTLHLVANEKYHGGKPKLSRFELNAYGTNNDLQDAVRAREVTAAFGIEGMNRDALEEYGYRAGSVPVDEGVYLLMNTSSDILSDKLVREAVRAAINPSEIRKKIDNTEPALGLPFITRQVRGAEEIAVPGYDVQKSKKLLERAKWKQAGDVRTKDKKPLTLTVKTTKSDEFEKVATSIADSLKAVGIDAVVTVIDTDAPSSNFVQDVLQGRNYDLLVHSLPIGADPDVYAYWHSSQLGASGYNFTNYKNAIADATLSSARERTEPKLREAKYRTFAKQWLSDVPAVGLYQRAISYGVLQSAEAYSDTLRAPTAADHYSSVGNWTVYEKRVYKTP